MGLCSSSNQPVNPNAPSGGAEKTRNASNGNALPRQSISDVDVSTLHGSALMSHRYKVARSQKHFKRPGSGNLEAAQSATSPGGDEKSWSLLTPKQRKLVTKMVQKNPVFTNVSEAMLEGLMGEIVSVSVEEGETVYQDGDDADLFYIVASGALVAMRGDQRKEYTEGQTVGEDALRLKSKRSGTCTVAQSGVLLALSRVVYQRLVVKFGAKELNRGVSRLRSVPILAPLTDQQLAMVADALTEVRFERNHQIIKQHDKGDAFYIIKHGEVVCRYENSTEKGRTVKAGDFFGEGALLSDSKRTMNVFAASRSVTCLRMSREDFLSILGGLHELLDHNFNKRVLSSVPLFKHLTDSEQDEVAEHMETRKYPEGEYIIRQGDQAAAFYIVRHGHVKVTRRNETGAITEVGVMVEGDFFGEGSFLTGDPTTANCIAATPDVICTALKREAFTEILGSIEDVLAQNFSERVKLWEPGEGIEWKDLVPISRLGQGNFGRVDIVRHKVSGKTFALKQLLRKKVELMQLEQYTENERAILADLQCPFVVRLHATYRTRHSVYFLMDFIVGGELSRVLEEMPSLPPDVARFYAANLVLALKYLHGKYICHRDIKPENIMVEKNGYLKLVDFGLAKRLKTGGRTFTICGTPDYVAAEVLRIGTSTGYGLAADWWALGILLFRFATGYHPFGLTSSSDLSEVWSILCEYANRYPHFEFGLPSEPLGDVVKRLLHPNPVKRLGGQKSGARKLMKHPFFSAIDWSSLARQTLSPPFAPDVKDMLDTTNFVDEEGEKNRDHLSVIAKDDPGDAWYANF